MENIVIYGVGEFGQNLFEFLKSIGSNIVYFVQSTEPETREYKGIPVISVNEYFKKNYEFLIFIAISNAGVVNDIYQLFASRNYNRNKILDCRSFIEDNYIASKNIETGDKVCNLCGHHFREFLPGGIDSRIYSKLKIIGGGYRKNVICPYCKSMDRNRWLYWVLKEKTEIFKTKCSVLHFAPEAMIQKNLLNNEKCDYYAGDIVIKRGLHKIDVTHIQFQDEFFDYILLNHVLEHVENEKLAFHELRRVLRPNGSLILSFPITIERDTFEKEGVYSGEERLKYYGQRDHVRLYGRDYKKHIEEFGWDVDEYIPDCLVDVELIQKYGFLQDDILLICHKK